MRLLIIRFSSLGDIILTTPVLAAIKARYPEATIDFLVMDKFSQAISGNPHLDNLLFFEKNRYKGFKGILRFARELNRKTRYDQVIDLHAKLRSILLSSLLKAPVYRYRKRRLWKSLGVSMRIFRYQVDDTIVNNYFGAVKHLGISPTEEILRFDYAQKDAEKVATYDNFVALAPGAANATKKWPVEYFAALGKILEEKIIVVGGPEDAADGEKIRQSIGRKCVNMAGKLNLKESGALIARAKYIVCNDSGPFHMARGVGTKAFVFFGPTDPNMFHYGKNATLIYAKLNCSPCSLHGDPKCPLKHFGCMRELTPERVKKIIIEHFDSTGES